jgi:two-component system, cell cycle sensor histidine kinase and response regulator CckA
VPTILLVEDDDIFRYAASRYLRKHGYTVVEASGSMEGLRIIDGGGIDVVVVDITLQPREPHGVALARMIRVKNPDIRVLFVTGYLDILKIEPGLEGETILYKPVELAELSRKIAELLS